MSDGEYMVNQVKRDGTRAEFDRFVRLALDVFERDADRLGLLVDDVRVCHGSFDFSALYRGEWPPLPPGDDPTYFAACNFKHEGSV